VGGALRKGSELNRAHIFSPSRTLQGAMVAGGAVVGGVLTCRAPALAAVIAGVVAVTACVVTARYGTVILSLGTLAIVGIVAEQATQGRLPASLKRLDDVVLFVGVMCLPLAAGRLRASHLRVALLGLALMAVSTMFGVVGTPASIGIAAGAAWQDARWLGAIALGLLIGELLPSRRRLCAAFQFLLLLNVANIAFSAYQVGHSGALPGRFGVPVAPGVFGHPSDGAIAATMLLVVLLADRWSLPRQLSRRAMAHGLAVAIVGLAISTRFKPLVALLAVMALLYLYRCGVRPLVVAALAGAVPVLVLLGLAWTRHVPSERGPTSALGNVFSHSSPRLQLIDGAARLADRGFPVGEGLGTFGSGLDERGELQSLADARLAGDYGFRPGEPLFTSDNFVAHILGERGYAGLVTWLGSLIAFTYLAFLLAPSNLFPAAALISSAAFAPLDPTFRGTGPIFLIFLPAALAVVLRQGTRWHAVEG
jgi:hypothetical protein